jgi:hypothetical protein
MLDENQERRGKRRGMEGEERRVEGRAEERGWQEGRGGEEGSMTKQKLDLQCRDIGDLDSI